MSRLRELSAEGALHADWTVIAQHGDFPTIWDAERVSLFMNRYKKDYLFSYQNRRK
jgi:hypothetical protein